MEGIKQEIKNELENKKDVLATKTDINDLKQDLLKFQIDMEKRFNQLKFWIVGTVIASAGVIIAMIKL